MTKLELAKMIDHTLLKPNATAQQIKTLATRRRNTISAPSASTPDGPRWQRNALPDLM